MTNTQPLSKIDSPHALTKVDKKLLEQIPRTVDDFPQHLPALRSFIAAKTRDTTHIDDITQETLARTYKSANIANLNNPLAYMITVAKTVIYDQWRSAPNIDAEIDPDSLPSCTTTLEQQHIHQQKVTAVAKALKQMPRLRRQVFEMRRLKGMPREQIAHELGISLDSVKKHISRAMVDLTQQMDKNGW